ncbi:MAG TPA: hypothetical protein VN796_08275 [Acidimicrobiales bacterium]|nr:hypothetical protein [Acidimicrobiales bacterium]
MRPWPKSRTQRRRRAKTAALAAAVVLLAGGSLIVVAAHGRGHGAVGSATRGTTAHVSGVAADATSPIPRGMATARKVLALTTADNLPPDCIPNPAGPPGAPYQLGLVGTAHGGVLTAGPTTVANISATFCGVVTVVNDQPPCGATGSVFSPPDGQVFGPLSVAFTLVPGMSPSVGFTANPGTITGTFTCAASSQNGLNVTLDATVSGTTAPLFGVSCTIGPLTIPLAGTVTGPFTDLTATLTSDDFTVPAVQTSPTCPDGVPANIDAIVGLPIAPGGASATLPVTASLYQPGP